MMNLQLREADPIRVMLHLETIFERVPFQREDTAQSINQLRILRCRLVYGILTHVGIFGDLRRPCPGQPLSITSNTMSPG